MQTMSLSHRLGPERAVPASMAVGSMLACAAVALVDPNGSGRYPVCPTRALLGIDCPVCGTLRGLHALSRGRIGEALDHNLLLLVAVPVGAVIWGRWVLAAMGRPARPRVVPGWVMPTVILAATAFAIMRNLPVHAVAWLDSSA